MCAGVGLVRHLRRRGRWIASHRAAELVSVLLLLLGLGQVHVFALIMAAASATAQLILAATSSRIASAQPSAGLVCVLVGRSEVLPVVPPLA